MITLHTMNIAHLLDELLFLITKALTVGKCSTVYVLRAINNIYIEAQSQ